MSIIKKEETTVFNTDEIHRGDFIRLQYDNDSKAVNGIVGIVKPESITVFYLSELSNVSNYIVLRVHEIENWYSVIWSSDLSEIKTADGGDEDGEDINA